MPPIDRIYAGGAVITSTTGAWTPVSPGGGGTFTVADDTGWPTGEQFPVKLDKGQSNEEHILCTRSGTTFTVVSRAYDGTSAQSHTDPTVEIYWDARTANLVVDHIDDQEVDPHSTKLLNNARHDIPARHTFGAGAFGSPAAPSIIIPGASSVGTGDNPATEDHLHGIATASATTITGANGAGSGNAFALANHDHALAANTIGASQLQADSVGSSELQNAAIDDQALFSTGLSPVIVSGSNPGAVGAGRIWFNTTVGKRAQLIRNAGNTAWEVIAAQDWISYTPSVFNITLGNGYIIGRYTRIGRTIVGNIFHWVGPTTVFAANIGFGIPVTAMDLDSFVGYPGVGTREFFGHGASRATLLAAGVYAAVGIIPQAGTAKALDRINFFATAGSAAWGAGVPGGWGSGDRLSIFYEYEAASAEDTNYV